MGALVAFFFAVETRAQVLEHVSPPSGAAEGPAPELLAAGN
jgi:hypothetical protein